MGERFQLYYLGSGDVYAGSGGIIGFCLFLIKAAVALVLCFIDFLAIFFYGWKLFAETLFHLPGRFTVLTVVTILILAGIAFAYGALLMTLSRTASVACVVLNCVVAAAGVIFATTYLSGFFGGDLLYGFLWKLDRNFWLNLLGNVGGFLVLFVPAALYRNQIVSF